MNLTGERMSMILLRFLRDSLDFLSDDERAKKFKRIEWIKKWQKENLSEKELKSWLPSEDQF